MERIKYLRKPPKAFEKLKGIELSKAIIEHPKSTTYALSAFQTMFNEGKLDKGLIAVYPLIKTR